MSDPQPISLDDLDRLGIDAASRLYWDGAEVVTSVVFSLPWWANLLAVIAAIAGIWSVVMKTVEFFDASKFKPKGKPDVFTGEEDSYA